MTFPSSVTRRDIILIVLGAGILQIWFFAYDRFGRPSTVLNISPAPSHEFTHLKPAQSTPEIPIRVRPPPRRPLRVTTTTTTTATATTTLAPALSTDLSMLSGDSTPLIDSTDEFPQTSIIDHAPGWTIFRNLYMSNGTLFILSSNQSFPEFKFIISSAIELNNTSENLEARLPTAQHMDFISPEEARSRWGGDEDDVVKHRVWTVAGNTVLFNDPKQFLRHYYHFVAELFFGAWAFWQGAWTSPQGITSTPQQPHIADFPSPPLLHRAIFTHADGAGWRDDPGFNAYFLRAAFPTMSVEVQEDWQDRISATSNARLRDRAWHFPMVLLVDRSAANWGLMCGTQTQRTAAEAVSYMVKERKIQNVFNGGWWEPIRTALWKFVGTNGVQEIMLETPENQHTGRQDGTTLPLPGKVVITYISRQAITRRKLVQEDHEKLVVALTELVEERGEHWELQVLEAERMTKDEQIQAAARTTILLGVHGNGLTHLVFMKPNRLSTVIELFYPGGFAHDYQWTARALGMAHYAIWNDTHHTYPNEPPVNYPEGFQGDHIPVHGPTIAQLIRERVASAILT